MTKVIQGIALTVLLSGLWAPASGAGPNLQVTARVLPRQPAPWALTALPVPPGTRAMTATRFGGSYHFADVPAAAADFYTRELPRSGYRLVHAAGDGSHSVWESGTARVEVRLAGVIGRLPGTRIVVQVSAHPGR